MNKSIKQYNEIITWL